MTTLEPTTTPTKTPPWVIPTLAVMAFAIVAAVTVAATNTPTTPAQTVTQTSVEQAFLHMADPHATDSSTLALGRRACQTMTSGQRTYSEYRTAIGQLMAAGESPSNATAIVHDALISGLCTQGN